MIQFCKRYMWTLIASVGVACILHPQLLSAAYLNLGSLGLNRTMIKESPKSVPLASFWGDSACEARPAERWLAPALHWNPHNAQAHRSLGRITLACGDVDSGTKELSIALHLDTKNVMNHVLLGSRYTVLEQTDQQALMRVWKANDVESLFLRVASHLHLEHEYAQELYWSQLAVAIDPNYVDAYLRMESVYARMGQWDEALEAFQHIIDVNPNVFYAYVTAGRVFFHGKKDPEKAVAALRTAIDLAPGNPAGYAGLCAIHTQLQQYDQALPLCVRAVSLAPDEGWTHYELGRVHFGMDFYQQAINELLLAVDYEPSHATAHYYLGLSYQHVGQIQQAREQLLRALQIRPGDERYLNALRKLDEDD